MTPEAHDAEIVEKPRVELPEGMVIPPQPCVFASVYPIRIASGKPCWWAWLSSNIESPEQAYGHAVSDQDRIGTFDQILLYRLGPPKPRMTEAEVRLKLHDCIRRYDETYADHNLSDAEQATAERIGMMLARELGVLPENET